MSKSYPARNVAYLSKRVVVVEGRPFLGLRMVVSGWWSVIKVK